MYVCATMKGSRHEDAYALHAERAETTPGLQGVHVILQHGNSTFVVQT